MLRMIQSKSSAHAKAYYTEALQKTDYYTNGQELQGQFHGLLAKRLGIEGAVTRDQFFDLADNINPKTGLLLTPKKLENRTIGYDINFHAPKSLSVLNFLSEDLHLQKVFEASVLETMTGIEDDIMTRVRVAGKDEDRKASGLIYGHFLHLTARPTDGSLPDPHLHSHAFVFNASYDDIEHKIKAGQFREIKRSMPFHQAKFHKILSDKLIDLGYQVQKTDNSFEIIGVPKSVTALFSKRSNEIGQFAKEHGITDAKSLDGLGALTRGKKQKGMSMSELKAEWRKQIAENIDIPIEEQEQKIRYAPTKEHTPIFANDCVHHAIEHSFERASVMPERRLLEQAYKYSIGYKSVSLENINDTLNNDKSIIKVIDNGRLVCTTYEVLRQEKHMVELAQSGINQFTPLYDKVPSIKADGQQATAIEHILTTSDQVSIVMGAAGSGKTTLMKVAIDLIEQSGVQVTVVAPTADASRGVLKDEGFANAETVDKLLVDKEMQAKLKGQALWVDEGGLLSTGKMVDILELCKKQKTRLIIGGDTRQHSSTERGDSLRILNTVGGIKAAEVNKIYRQKDQYYREAIEDLHKGNVSSAFDKLNQIEAIIQIDPLNPNKQLVDDFLEVAKKGKTALIVSPTHKHGNTVTAELRKRLKENGMLKKREITATKLVSTKMTTAERADWRSYTENQAIQFNQNIKGIKRGSLWSVDKIDNSKITIRDTKGNKQHLPLDKAKFFEVYYKREIGLSEGDKIKITRNSYDEKGKRLDNKTEIEVSKITKSGNVIFHNPKSKRQVSFDKDFGHFDHNYFTTSHASQGKTVDTVFVAQPASTFSATDSKQFYVSASRGREFVKIYTDDKDELLRNAMITKDRQSAIELTMSHSEYVAYQEKQKHILVDTPVNTKVKTPTKYIDYEPEL